MKTGLTAVVLVFFSQLLAQRIPEFIAEARYHLEDHDTFSQLTEARAGTGTINVLSDSVATIESLLVSVFLSNYRTTSDLDTLRESLVLRQLSQIACKRISGIVDAKPEKASRIRRKLFRVFRSAQSSFGLIEFYAFDLELVQHHGAFYYDRKGDAGGFNLYKGKRKPKPTKEEPEPETIPLELVTEAEMLDQLKAQMRKKGLTRELKGGMMSCVGYAVIPNRKTFFRKKIPTVKVVVITGTRRLRLLH